MTSRCSRRARSRPRATRREWTGLAVIAPSCLLYAAGLTVPDLAVPALGAERKPSAAQRLWIIDIDGVRVAGALITLGAPHRTAPHRTAPPRPDGAT